MIEETSIYIQKYRKIIELRGEISSKLPVKKKTYCVMIGPSRLHIVNTPMLVFVRVYIIHSHHCSKQSIAGGR